MGRQFKFTDIYISWLLTNKPAGTYTNLQLLRNLDALVAIKPLYFDVDNGTIGGVSIHKIEDIRRLYPSFKEEKNKSGLTSYGWKTGGNSVSYYSATQEFSYTSMHRFTSNVKLMDADTAAVRKMLGQPDRRVKKSERLFYCYKKPWGTLEVNFAAFDDSPIAGIISMYAVKAEEITYD